MRIAVVLLIAGVTLAGCGGAVRETWSKAGTTPLQVTRDVSDCERAATIDPTHGQEQGAYGAGGPRKNQRLFDACMRARGYEPATRG